MLEFDSIFEDFCADKYTKRKEEKVPLTSKAHLSQCRVLNAYTTIILLCQRQDIVWEIHILPHDP